MARILPVWRSSLYVPVIVERFVDKAHERGADAVILDLEDSIPPAEKVRARTLVTAAAAKVGRGGADVTVRVNREWRSCIADLEAVVSPAVCGIILPKVADASHVRFVAEVLDELEAARGMEPGTTGIVALIETPDALFQVRDIAGASPRMLGITLGGEDFAAACGMASDADGLMQPSLQVAFAASAAGILPLGFIGSIADFTDLDGFRAMLMRSRRLGFCGGACIHPTQVAALNEAFTPTAEEIEHARGLLDIFDEALEKGLGAVTYRGKMIDIPIVQKARRVIATDDAIRTSH
jgi:citrate lyase subunit beta/citryl-CoA lyase